MVIALLTPMSFSNKDKQPVLSEEEIARTIIEPLCRQEWNNKNSLSLSSLSNRNKNTNVVNDDNNDKLYILSILTHFLQKL